jgi:DNA-binding GntR family transcriptional regulator
MPENSLSEEVYKHILNMILNQELNSCDKIPEERIAKMFGVSRTPIREALRKLNVEGLVNLYPRRFAEVASFDEEMTKNIGLTRVYLDKLAVELVILNGSNAEFEELEVLANSCFEYSKANDRFNTVRTDSQFHLAIARLSKNIVLYDILDAIHLKVRLIQMNVDKTQTDLEKHVDLHLPIVEAIKKRDPDLAVMLVLEHLINFYDLQDNYIVKRL